MTHPNEDLAYEALEMKVLRMERCLKRMKLEIKQRWRVTEDVALLQRLVDEMKGCDELVAQIRSEVDSHP